MRIDGPHALVARSATPEKRLGPRAAPSWFEIDLAGALGASRP